MDRHLGGAGGARLVQAVRDDVVPRKALLPAGRGVRGVGGVRLRHAVGRAAQAGGASVGHVNRAVLRRAGLRGRYLPVRVRPGGLQRGTLHGGVGLAALGLLLQQLLLQLRGAGLGPCKGQGLGSASSTTPWG